MVKGELLIFKGNRRLHATKENGVFCTSKLSIAFYFWSIGCNSQIILQKLNIAFCTSCAVGESNGDLSEGSTRGEKGTASICEFADLKTKLTR